MTYAAEASGRATSSRSSTLTPLKVVSSLDHVVTQWMSPKKVEPGTACSSGQVHVCGDSTRPSMLNVHDSSDWCGVASALSTGHEDPVSYCPGGSRPRSGSGRRRWNPRVTGIDAPGSRLVRDRTGASLPWTAVDRTRPDGSAV